MSAVPIIILSEINYETQKQLAITHLENDLKTIASDRIKHVSTIWNLRVQQIESLATNEILQSLFDSNQDQLDDVKKDLRDTELVEFQQTTGDGSGFFDFIVMNLDGTAIFSMDVTQEGKDYSNDPKFIRGLSESFYNIEYKESDAKATIVVTVPIYSHAVEKRLVGVLTAKRNINLVEQITTDRTGLQESGETYIVNQDEIIVTPSRFISDAQVRQTVDTIPVRACFDEGRSISGTWNDYRPNGGIPVFGSSFCDRYNGFMMLAEIDVAEALAPIENIKQDFYISSLSAILLSVILGFFASHSISAPIRKLSHTTKMISEGKLDTRIKSKRTDEIGILEKSFNFMMDSIQKKDLELVEKTVLETQLKEHKIIEKQKDEFASMISHELKTPLLPIMGYIELLKTPDISKNMTAEQLEYLNEIYANAERLESLISDLLSVQRLELHIIKFNYSEIELDKIMNDIYDENSVYMIEKNIQFTNTTNEKIIFESDPERIKQVFTNILKNSVDFVPEKAGKIEIGAKSDGDKILFYVKDNGIGISKDKQDNLFKKFYQVDTSYTRVHVGTGLSLVICKGIIEGLGGRIWVESKEGKRTTFYFILPKNLDEPLQ